MEIFNKALDR